MPRSIDEHHADDDAQCVRGIPDVRRDGRPPGSDDEFFVEIAQDHFRAIGVGNRNGQEAFEER